MSLPGTQEAEVDSLVDQLKKAASLTKRNEQEQNTLKKEDIEKFVIERSGELIQESMDLIRTIKDNIISSPNHCDVEALAGLITAASGAIETLNRQIIVDKKAEVIYKSKELDAKNRKASLIDETHAKLLLTREQMVKELATQALKKTDEAIEIEAVTVTSSLSGCT